MTKAPALRSWHAQRSDGEGGTRVFSRDWRAKGDQADAEPFVPLCMDADELVDWQRINRTTQGHHKAATPCHDCLPGFAADMRAEGRCNGTPRGAVNDEEEPALRPGDQRRSRHMAKVKLEISVPCATCLHMPVCSRRDAINGLGDAMDVEHDPLPGGVSLALAGTVECDAYLPIKVAAKRLSPEAVAAIWTPERRAAQAERIRARNSASANEAAQEEASA